MVEGYELWEEQERRLITFLEYVPEEWNIENILKKPASDCSYEDILILKRIKEENLIAQTIRNKMNGIEYDKDLYVKATRINTLKLVKEKFDFDLLMEECKNSLLENQTYDVCMKKLENKKRSAFEEAMLYSFDCMISGSIEICRIYPELIK